MKRINEYTIYCTEEQTKKALKLGVHLEIEPYDNPYLVPQKYPKVIVKYPTAEQMRGWLMERLGATTFANKHYSCCDREGYGYLIIGRDVVLEVDAVDNGRYLLDSDKEATLAAIDAALDYLIEHKLLK